MLTAIPLPRNAERTFAHDLAEAQAWWADVRNRFRLGDVEDERAAQERVIAAFADALCRYGLGLTEQGAKDLAGWLLAGKDTS